MPTRSVRGRRRTSRRTHDVVWNSASTARTRSAKTDVWWRGSQFWSREQCWKWLVVGLSASHRRGIEHGDSLEGACCLFVSLDTAICTPPFACFDLSQVAASSQGVVRCSAVAQRVGLHSKCVVGSCPNGVESFCVGKLFKGGRNSLQATLDYLTHSWSLIAMVGTALHTNLRPFALAIMIGFSSYLRPSELFMLQATRSVPPPPCGCLVFFFGHGKFVHGAACSVMITNDGRTTRHREKNKQGTGKDPPLLRQNASSDHSVRKKAKTLK